MGVAGEPAVSAAIGVDGVAGSGMVRVLPAIGVDGCDAGVLSPEAATGDRGAMEMFRPEGCSFASCADEARSKAGADNECDRVGGVPVPAGDRGVRMALLLGTPATSGTAAGC